VYVRFSRLGSLKVYLLPSGVDVLMKVSEILASSGLLA
jgi:hypothetical protein